MLLLKFPCKFHCKVPARKTSRIPVSRGFSMTCEVPRNRPCIIPINMPCNVACNVACKIFCKILYKVPCQVPAIKTPKIAVDSDSIYYFKVPCNMSCKVPCNISCNVLCKVVDRKISRISN